MTLYIVASNAQLPNPGFGLPGVKCRPCFLALEMACAIINLKEGDDLVGKVEEDEAVDDKPGISGQNFTENVLFFFRLLLGILFDLLSKLR